MATILAETTRGPLTESIHHGNVAVVDTRGNLIAFGGDPDVKAFFRSSAKPYQAVPVVLSGAADKYAFTTEELALSCASHNATPRHQSIVASILDKIGAAESDLRCGFSPPLDEEEQARITLGLKEASQIRCECSGEHAGMLAACQARGWPLEDYVDPEHPLQGKIRSIVARACGISASDLDQATDGCSIPTFGAALGRFAFAYAVIADPAGAAWEGTDAERAAIPRLRDAITLHPDLISGEGETDTVIMQQTNGRIVAKLGAEGLLCLAIPEHGLGVAISDAAGSTRSLGPAAIAVMQQLEIENQKTLDALTQQLCPPIESFVGHEVGETRPVLRLERP